MKTVEELAKEYQEGLTGHITRYESHGLEFPIRTHFIAGYNKAKEWISVEDELPEEGRDIVVKTFGVCPMACIYNNKNGYVSIWRNDNTVPFEPSHWKYIE